MGDLILLAASFVYFWTMMFEYRPRISSIFAGTLLISCIGIVTQQGNPAAFEILRDASISAILIRRVWLLHKDHEHA